MQLSPYSIYIDKRPIRLAFLLDRSTTDLSLLDTVFDYSRRKWGGRYYAIALTDGNSLTEAWWALLKFLDPDVIKCLVPLEQELASHIDVQVCPYLIEPDQQPGDADHYNLHLHDDGLSILPTHRNVRSAAWAIGESNLILFETHWERTDPLIKRFVEWNFGTYSPATADVQRALEGVRTRQFVITDADSLAAALAELSSFGNFTYPIQLCSLPKTALPDVEYQRPGEAFTVVVGDTVEDAVYYWNRPLVVPQWTRTYLNQVWLPTPLATEQRLTPALASWFRRAADPSGTTDKEIWFVSSSLSEASLREMLEPILSRIPLRLGVARVECPQGPQARRELAGPRLRPGMDLYRVSGQSERITLREPEVEEGVHGGEHWMADVYIQFDPGRHPTILGRDLWWQLPRRNGLVQTMFAKPSRILASRFPSVCMQRGSRDLDIALFDELTLFRLLLLQPDTPPYSTDVRRSSLRSPFKDARRSDKGRYLSGVLDLFSGLHPAAHVVEQRYWRRMFDILCRRTSESDAELHARIANKLRKQLQRNPGEFYRNEPGLGWLVNYLLHLARTLPEASLDIPFSKFEAEAKAEIAEFKERQRDGRDWSYSRDDLEGTLGNLIKRNIILMGIRIRCPSCGYRSWYHIDVARQTLQCDGCGVSFPIPPEPVWYYRLNSLVRASYSLHGLVPVVLVLGQLLLAARSAFMFAPSLEVAEADAGEASGDLDIVAVCDGELVIGEVKQSCELFDQAAFTKMADIAKRLRPDVLLFSALEPKPSAIVEENIRRLAKELSAFDVRVVWYQLHAHVFEASPVR